MTQCVIDSDWWMYVKEVETMARKKQEIKQQEEKVSPILAPLRRVMLASMGAVAIAQEEAEELINKLVERGEIAREEGRDLMQDMMAKRREKVEGRFDARVEGALEKMNVPTKADLKAVEKKLDELNKKLDKLVK